MIKVVWNVIKYFLGIVQRLLYPLKRLVCRRRKLSTSDAIELTSIGSGDGYHSHMNNSVSGSLPHNGTEDLEMEAWDSWSESTNQQTQQQYHESLPSSGSNINSGNSNSGHYDNHPHPHNHSHQQQHGMTRVGRGGSMHQQHWNNKNNEPEPEPEINFFEDMTPAVRKQRKFLIRKSESDDTPFVSDRLSVMSAVRTQESSELESWQDNNTTAWEDDPETVEDISWEAEEALREQKRKERMERQVQHQKKKKMMKEEMRGGGRSQQMTATKLS